MPASVQTHFTRVPDVIKSLSFRTVYNDDARVI